MLQLYRGPYSLLILVGMAKTCLSEKNMISYSCICGFMPNLQKKIERYLEYL